MKHGNSRAVVIDRPILDLLRLAPEFQVELTTSDEQPMLRLFLDEAFEIFGDCCGFLHGPHSRIFDETHPTQPPAILRCHPAIQRRQRSNSTIGGTDLNPLQTDDRRRAVRREAQNSNQLPDPQPSAETRYGARDVASGLSASVTDGQFFARPGGDGVNDSAGSCLTSDLPRLRNSTLVRFEIFLKSGTSTW